MHSTPGELIRHHRSRSGLGQRELASLAGISERSLRDIETERVSHPRVSSLRRLATALSLTEAETCELLAFAHPFTQTTNPALFLGILGPLLLLSGNVPVRIGAPMQRDLLGLLALRPGEHVMHEEIIDVLWGDRPPKSCTGLVRAYVSALRRLLQPHQRHRTLITIAASRRAGYRLELEADPLDLLRFEDIARRARDAGRAGDRERTWDLLERAAGCWRGPALAGSRLAQHPVAVALNQRRSDTLLELADIALATGRHHAAVRHLQDIAGDEPLHEALHARLIVALSRAGDQAAALAAFAKIRDRLADELGVRPGHKLETVRLRVLRGQLSAGPQPKPAADTVPAQLPPAARGFAARSRELAVLDGHLDTYGEQPPALTVITVSGTAGVGKTTLAVHWAQRVRDRFPDGQLYVNLRGFGPDEAAMDAGEAVRGFLNALHVPAERIPDGFEAQVGLYRSLAADRRMLILLDNAEHAEQVRPLLPGAPGCLVLVTSRDRLSGLVAAEGAHPLSLDLPTVDEARELVTARLGGERVAADPEAVDVVIERCARLPLALAVVTARAVANPRFPLAALAGELRRAQDGLDPFDGDDPATQVRAVFSWSYRILDGDSARLFRLLALSPGPDIGRRAAAHLAGVPERRVRLLLDDLVRAHLVTEHSPGRYSFHELLRLYAAERNEEEDDPGESADAVRRLFDHYTRTALAAAALLYSQTTFLPRSPPTAGSVSFADHGDALAWLDAEYPNLVAAIGHAARHGPRPAAWMLGDALRPYLARRRHPADLREVAELALPAAEAAGDLAGQAAMHLSVAQARHSLAAGQEATITHLHRAIDLSRRAGLVQYQAAAVCNLGIVHAHVGRHDEARDAFLTSIDLFRQVKASGSEALAFNNLGTLERNLGRLSQAAEYLAQALAIWQGSGSTVGFGTTLGTLAEVYHALGRFDPAMRHAGAAMDVMRDIKDRAGEAGVLVTMSRLHSDAGRDGDAFEAARAALRVSQEAGHRLKEADAFNCLALCHDRLGRHQEAIGDYSRGLALARQAGSLRGEIESRIGLATARANLGDLPGASVHAADAVALSRRCDFRLLTGQALTVLARIRLDQDDHAEAARLAEEAIALHGDTGHRLGQARALAVLGAAAYRTAGLDSALPHWKAALAISADAGARDTADLRARVDRPGGR